MTKKAKKLSVYLSLVVMPVSIGAVGLATHAYRPRQSSSVDAAQEMDAAYRDGLFWGRFDGQDGRKVRPSVGRWNTDKDRASFTAGYQKAYREALAARSGEHRH
jgi:hypothetical protein